MINIDNRLLPMINEDELWLLVHVAKRMGKDMSCFPSLDTLMKDTKWSRNTVKKHRKALIEKKILNMRERWVGEGKRSSNNYQINTPFLGVHVTLQHIEHAQNKGGQLLTPQGAKVSNFDTLGGSNFGGVGGSTFNPLSINHSNTHTFKEGEGQNLTFDKTEIKNPLNQIEFVKNQIAQFFQLNPDSKNLMMQNAAFIETPPNRTFESEIAKWVNWNSDSAFFMGNPIKQIGKFENWLRKSKNYNNQNQKNGSSNNPAQKGKHLIDETTARSVLEQLSDESL